MAQLIQQGQLSAAAQAYVTTLAGVVSQLTPATLAALPENGLAYLETLPAAEQPAAVALALSLARLCDQCQYPAGAAAVQVQAIGWLRQDESPQGQETLSVALYNYAGYLAQLEQFAGAVAAMEEVVAIDERLGLADLAADQATLAAMRARQEGVSPESEAGAVHLLAGLEAQLDGLPPAEQAQLRQFLEQAARLSPEEQAALVQDMGRHQLAAQADQIDEAARSAWQAGQVADLLPRLDEAALHLADGEAPGSAYADLAQYVRAVMALLQGHSPEPVAPAYVERLALLQQQLR
jgi:hypothetical protein